MVLVCYMKITTNHVFNLRRYFYNYAIIRFNGETMSNLSEIRDKYRPIVPPFWSALENIKVRKAPTYICGQFHPQFRISFFANFHLPKNYKIQTVGTEKLCKTLLYEKADCKMLVKLTTYRITHTESFTYYFKNIFIPMAFLICSLSVHSSE